MLEAPVRDQLEPLDRFLVRALGDLAGHAQDQAAGKPARREERIGDVLVKIDDLHQPAVDHLAVEDEDLYLTL